jgi:sugar phosphate permease
MSLNGFFQATVWPGVIGIFGNWFKKGNNSTLLAIWAMSGNIGNIYASNICNIL